MRDLACPLQDFIFGPSPQNIEKTKVVGSGHQVIPAKSWVHWSYTQNILFKELSCERDPRVYAVRRCHDLTSKLWRARADVTSACGKAAKSLIADL